MSPSWDPNPGGFVPESVFLILCDPYDLGGRQVYRPFFTLRSHAAFTGLGMDLYSFKINKKAI